MTERIDIDEWLEEWGTHAVIDVRSPEEFSRGHIPGAINLPLFDDDQRAQIGRLYKQTGKDAALLAGLDFAGPKMGWLVMESRRLADDRPILLHCWRGGR